MKIADIFNEKSKEYYRQENSTEYAYITADEYTPYEVVKMEKEVLNILNFDLYSPTTVAFIKMYNKILAFDQKTVMCSLYLSDLLLLDSKSNKFQPSLLASSCLLVSKICLLPSIEDVSITFLFITT